MIPVFDLADRLHKSLRVAGLRPGQMAEHLEVRGETVSRYLTGRVRPTVATLRVWALRCGVPFEWLRDGDDVLPRVDSNHQPADYLFPQVSGGSIPTDSEVAA